MPNDANGALPDADEVQGLTELSEAIVAAQRPIRILKVVTWPDEVREAFFRAKAKELPRPMYCIGFDVEATVAAFTELRGRVRGGRPLDALVRETIDGYVVAARMLGAVGTRDFYRHSVDLYGRPGSVFVDEESTNVDLAQHFDAILTAYQGVDLGEPQKDEVGADEAAAYLERVFEDYFHSHDIRVEVVDLLDANAAAGAEVVKLKRGVRFTRRDLEQLEQHEGYVHVGTTLNGRAQPVLKFLAKGAPRTTRTQEGLAIFAEFVTQKIELDRLRRLTDRILAIRMAEEGADFLELYRFFLGRGHVEEHAFDNARRVVRGGLVEGGAPFTKDVVYLDGLVRVHNFLRVSVKHRRPEYARLLFAGKLDIDDVPVLAPLWRAGLVVDPPYLPHWIRDLRYLTAYMAYSGFLNTVDMAKVEAKYLRQFGQADGGRGGG